MDEGAPIVRPKRFSPRLVIAGIRRRLKAISRREWRTIILAALGFAALTIAFTRLAHLLLDALPLSENGGGAVLVLSVFAIFLIANLSLLVPVPITMPIIIAAATTTNPVFVGLAAAIGGAIGELGGYVGRLGHSVLVRENYMCHLYNRFCNSRLQADVEKHGPLAIFILAVQPVLPFDVAGLFAGSVKMDVRKFFLALLAGRTVKYVTLSLLAGVLGYVPFLR